MTKRSETQKIRSFEKRWDESLAWLNNGFKEVWRRVKRFFRKEMEGMMYGVKPRAWEDRLEHAFWWWMKLGIIILAFKGAGII